MDFLAGRMRDSATVCLRSEISLCSLSIEELQGDITRRMKLDSLKLDMESIKSLP